MPPLPAAMPAAETHTRPAWTEAQADEARRRIGSLVRHYAGELEIQAALSIAIRLEDARVEDAVQLRLELPPDGLAFLASPHAGEPPLILLHAADLARALASAAERTGIQPVSPAKGDEPEALGALAAILAGCARDAFGVEDPEHGRIPQWHATVLPLEGSQWKGPRDPLGEPAYAVAPASFTLAGQAAGTARWMVPLGMFRERPAEAPAAAPSADAGNGSVREERDANVAPPDAGQPAEASPAAAPEPAAVMPAPAAVAVAPAVAAPPPAPAPREHPHAVFFGPEEHLPRILELLEGARVTRLETPASLREHVEIHDRPRLVVAWVPPGGDAGLDALAALARDPSLAGRRLVVLLEAPLKSVVLACGRLGLVNVAPAGADRDILRRRLAAILNRPLE